MATLRNKRKLAAVPRDTQESAGNGQSQNTFVPGMTEKYITQMSEEKEVRAIKKLSQDFSRTESRILGAFSKLDEFILKPQVRTCSKTVPRTSRNNNSEHREPTRDRSPNDRYPEVDFSVRPARTSLIETGKRPPKWGQQFKKRFPLAPLGLHQENKRRRTQQVSPNSAVKTRLRKLKQTRFC